MFDMQDKDRSLRFVVGPMSMQAETQGSSANASEVVSQPGKSLLLTKRKRSLPCIEAVRKHQRRPDDPATPWPTEAEILQQIAYSASTYRSHTSSTTSSRLSMASAKTTSSPEIENVESALLSLLPYIKQKTNELEHYLVSQSTKKESQQCVPTQIQEFGHMLDSVQGMMAMTTYRAAISPETGSKQEQHHDRPEST